MFFPSCSQQSGFTLIETVVAIVIMGVLVTLLTQAYPVNRDHQDVLLAQQSVTALLKEAQQAALNEERAEACLAEAEQTGFEPHRCSDVGVAFAGNEVTVFADTSDTGQGSLDARDYVLRRTSLPGRVQATGDSVYIFRGEPPTVTLFVGKRVVYPGTLTLTSGSSAVTLEIYNYGRIKRQ